MIFQGELSCYPDLAVLPGVGHGGRHQKEPHRVAWQQLLPAARVLEPAQQVEQLLH